MNIETPLTFTARIISIALFPESSHSVFQIINAGYGARYYIVQKRMEILTLTPVIAIRC